MGASVESGSATTSIEVQVLDAADGSLIIAPTVAKVIGGTVIDALGHVTTSLVSENGFFSFALAESEIPKNGIPIARVIVVQSPGYTSTSLSVSMTGTGAHNYELRLVNTANPPKGVSSRKDAFAAVMSLAGVTTQLIVTTPVIEPYSTVNTSVSIPMNTLITDAQGTPLQGDLYSH